MARPHAIFISYRRSDTSDVAGRLYDRLKGEFGAELVFKDVDNIPLGKEFGDHIKDVLRQCRVALILIGPRWLAERDAAGASRLESPADWVRIEIETALHTSGLKVIPVLVNGAAMPREADLPASLHGLLRLNAGHLRADPDFHHDADRMLRALRKGGLNGARPGQWVRRGLLGAVAAGLGAGALALWPPPPENDDDLPIPDGFYLVSDNPEDTDVVDLPMRGMPPVRVNTTPLVEGRGIRRAIAEQDSYGRMVISINLNERGAAQMQTATVTNTGRRLALVVRGNVVFDAVIQSPLYSDISVTGDYSEQEARAIAARLNRRARA